MHVADGPRPWTLLKDKKKLLKTKLTVRIVVMGYCYCEEDEGEEIRTNCTGTLYCHNRYVPLNADRARGLGGIKHPPPSSTMHGHLQIAGSTTGNTPFSNKPSGARSRPGWDHHWSPVPATQLLVLSQFKQKRAFRLLQETKSLISSPAFT